MFPSLFSNIKWRGCRSSVGAWPRPRSSSPVLRDTFALSLRTATSRTRGLPPLMAFVTDCSPLFMALGGFPPRVRSKLTHVRARAVSLPSLPRPIRPVLVDWSLAQGNSGWSPATTGDLRWSDCFSLVLIAATTTPRWRCTTPPSTRTSILATCQFGFPATSLKGCAPRSWS